MMNWWRAHHGISNDAKLQFLATRAGVKRCEIGWVWIILVDFSSQNEPRGSTFGLSIAEIAFMAEIPEQDVSSIIDAMKERGMIQADGMLSSWSKRQPQRDREQGDRTAAERQRRRRLKLKTVGQSTEEDAPEHHENVTDLQRDVAVTAVTVTNVTEEHRDTLPQVPENVIVSDAPVTPCHAQNREEKRREEYIREECGGGELFPPPKNGGGSPPLEATAAVNGDSSKPRNRKTNRTIAEIRKALGPLRLPWWEAFWKVYPCHGGTNEAMDAYERRILTREVAVQAYNGAKRYATFVAEKLRVDPSFTPKYGQGWINKERYIDNLDPVEPEPPKPTKPMKINYIDPMALWFEKQREEQRLKAEGQQGEVKIQ